MFKKLCIDGCLYQDDVVDYLVKNFYFDFLKENADGNLALATNLLTAFKKPTLKNVVWVKPDRYWRFRVLEDEPGREARG
ncbi:hypothetical protein C5B72_13370 [Acinetobacter sp. KU 011TH]|nr:hypothetical protein C5B72_13370 [Acinetobacter sp. KU 011TH]TDM62614.1 hypothetical protein C4608_13380 [Acinetobacter sp. KU 013TH]